MSNTTNPSVEEFRRSLEALVQQAQATAQLGFVVAKEQVETLVRNPPTLPAQMEEVQRNLQAVAKDIEAKAQELVALAATVLNQQGASPFGQPARPQAPVTEVKIERDAAAEHGDGPRG
jgi:hypothetical protein